MSETVQYKGKLKFVPKLHKNETLNEQCERILKECDKTNIDLDFYEGDFVWAVYDELYNKYVIAGHNVYEIIEKISIDPDYDIFNATQNLDGTIDFHVMYYNGGCSFNEAIEEAISNME